MTPRSSGPHHGQVPSPGAWSRSAQPRGGASGPVPAAGPRRAPPSVLLVLRAAAGQPGGQPLDGHLELGVLVDERLHLVGQPGEGHLLLAPPVGQLLQAPVREVHGWGGLVREGLGHETLLLDRSEEHTSELQSRQYLVCRLLLEKKNQNPPFTLPYQTTCRIRSRGSW